MLGTLSDRRSDFFSDIYSEYSVIRENDGLTPGDISLHTDSHQRDVKIQLGLGNPDHISFLNSLKSEHMDWDKFLFYDPDANDILIHLRVQR